MALATPTRNRPATFSVPEVDAMPIPVVAALLGVSAAPDDPLAAAQAEGARLAAERRAKATQAQRAAAEAGVTLTLEQADAEVGRLGL